MRMRGWVLPLLSMTACTPLAPVVAWHDTPMARNAVLAQASDDLHCDEHAIFVRDAFDGEKVATGCGGGAVYHPYTGRGGRVFWHARERFRVARSTP
jgi:hypothetical protein